MDKIIKNTELNSIKTYIYKELGLLILDTKIISSFNNIVYKLTTDRGRYVLKVMTNKNAKDCLDFYYFNELNKLVPEFNQIIFLFKKNKEIKRDFIISEYAEGKALSTILYKKHDYKIIANNLIKFYKRFSNITVSGYGSATHDFKAPCSSWREAIKNQLTKTEKRSSEFNKYAGNKYIALLREKLDLIDRPFRAVLFPADFNLNNFFITRNYHIKLIESEYYYIGDPLVPYGALLTHIYGTKLEEELLKEIQHENYKKLSFYAILEAISIWSYNFMMHGDDDPAETRPFGNKNTLNTIVEELSKTLS